MVSHAVNEGIIKFVAERNGEDGDHEALIDLFQRKGIMSKQCADASKEIWGSFRNDVHHMNPKVESLPFTDIAKENIKRLAIIENEIFGADIQDGKLVPHQPKYWDMNEDGTLPVYLRLDG